MFRCRPSQTTDMTWRVFIDGAAGTTGLEIRERLAKRDAFEIVALDEGRRKDVSARREALNEADFAILCLPDDAAREAVSLVDPKGMTRIVDASSAHRVAPGWTYGFPEIMGRDAVASARRVSNPGCYPTGFLALIAPLVRAGILPSDHPYSVHAVSGYSGGGNALIDRFRAAGDIAFRSYALQMGHKHLSEMRAHAGLAHPPIFSPAVVRAFRGMIVEVPLPLHALRGSPTTERLRSELSRFYESSQVVRVSQAPVDELLLRDVAEPWDGMELFVCGGDSARQARLVARLDNLGKGASGAAVQSLNLMTGLPETEGLALRD